MRHIAFDRRDALRIFAGSIASSLAGADALAKPLAAAAKIRWQHALPLIVIDPGHGGIDPGAIGESGVFEKHVVLAIATDVARRLTATRRFRVAMTCCTDVFLPLRERVAHARALRADLFLSIHADALPEATLRGLSVYTLSSRASDREAAALADSENRETVGGVRLSHRPSEISDILIELAQRQTGNYSLALARDVATVLGQQVALLDNPQRSAGFVVLTAPDIPSALVETGCLSNPVEERLLQQRAHQQRLAHGLAEAISLYFDHHGVQGLG